MYEILQMTVINETCQIQWGNERNNYEIEE